MLCLEKRNMVASGVSLSSSCSVCCIWCCCRWHRGRIAEVNRHRVVLLRYLDLCGRVDVAAVERCVQHSIGRGWDPGVLLPESSQVHGSSSSNAIAMLLIHETIQVGMQLGPHCWGRDACFSFGMQDRSLPWF